MKNIKIIVLGLAVILFSASQVVAEPQVKPMNPNISSKLKNIPKNIKNIKPAPKSFQVASVTFDTIVLDNTTRLVAAVVFNHNIDASTVKENVNIRMLKQDGNFWVDASTHNNIVNVRSNFITWVSGATLENGAYKMHLRGTIKNQDGDFLDCDGDGYPERGNLPAYDSQIYHADITESDEGDDNDSGLMHIIESGSTGEGEIGEIEDSSANPQEMQVQSIKKTLKVFGAGDEDNETADPYQKFKGDSQFDKFQTPAGYKGVDF